MPKKLLFVLIALCISSYICTGEIVLDVPIPNITTQTEPDGNTTFNGKDIQFFK